MVSGQGVCAAFHCGKPQATKYPALAGSARLKPAMTMLFAHPP